VDTNGWFPAQVTLLMEQLATACGGRHTRPLNALLGACIHLVSRSNRRSAAMAEVAAALHVDERAMSRALAFVSTTLNTAALDTTASPTVPQQQQQQLAPPPCAAPEDYVARAVAAVTAAHALSPATRAQVGSQDVARTRPDGLTPQL
jgi:hypothetical protein